MYNTNLLILHWNIFYLAIYVILLISIITNPWQNKSYWKNKLFKCRVVLSLKHISSLNASFFNHTIVLWYFQKLDGSDKQKDHLFYSLLISGHLLALPLTYRFFLLFSPTIFANILRSFLFFLDCWMDCWLWWNYHFYINNTFNSKR